MPDPIPHGQQVGVTIDATKALAKLLAVQKAFTVRDLLSAIGQNELRWTSQNLQQAGKAVGGSPWPKMAPMTLERRPIRKSDYHFSAPYQTLLEQSMVMKIDEAAASVSIGTAARYAVEHHLGVPSRRLPARPLLAAPDVAREHALRIMDGVVKILTRQTKA